MRYHCLFYLFHEEPKCIRKGRNGTGEGEAGQNVGRSGADEVVWFAGRTAPDSAVAAPEVPQQDQTGPNRGRQFS